MTTSSIERINKGAAFYIVTPADGIYGGQPYAGSGQTVAVTVKNSLEPYTSNALRGPGVSTLDEAVDAAKTKNCDYVLIPIITHWEDRTTEWSGKADRLAIHVEIYRVTDKTEITNVDISSKSSWFTLGGDHPQDLLKKPIDEFISTLF